MSLPSWKLPKGVYRGTWDYLQSTAIAKDYDRYFADSQLMQLDQQFIRGLLPPITDSKHPPVVADFGCGTGRISRLLSPLGYRMLNVDLSPTMLEVARSKCEHPALNEFIQSNLVELDGMAPHSLDMAVCLFSSIGMIRGREHRRQFLRRARPALKPDAALIVHVHNRYHSLWHPSGPTWLVATWLKSRFSKQWEYGDRIFVDLGLPKMFLHIYSERELRSDLSAAGFQQIEIFPINVPGNQLLNRNPLTSWRAGGFFAVAR